MEINLAKFSDDIAAVLEEEGSVDIAVAFVSSSGLEEIRTLMDRKLSLGGRIRLLLDLKEGFTDPAALWDLIALKANSLGLLHLRGYIPEAGILHAKFYVSNGEEKATLITGSANLTSGALYENEEHGVTLRGNGSDGVIAASLREFQRLWDSEDAFEIDEEAVRLYELYCGRKRASLNKAHRRSLSIWRDLVKHLKEGPDSGFEWPSVDAAFLLGAITARGFIRPETATITIPLLFNAGAYKDGRITVRDSSFEAAEVLPSIPITIADRAAQLFPNARVAVDKMRVSIEMADDPDTFDIIEGLLAPETDCNSFGLPSGLASADYAVVAEFVRGFAMASALLTDNTSMPGNPRTGLPGAMVVWLRPKQYNQTLYDELDQVITRRLHMTVYHHRRTDRDPHLKLLCDDFSEIGFGVDWWDQLLESGSEYNQVLFPQAQLFER